MDPLARSARWPCRRHCTFATLSEVAHVDGLHPAARETPRPARCPLRRPISTTSPQCPRDLSALPWATRVLVYRDAVTLALADEMSAEEEERYLRDLAETHGVACRGPS